MGISKAQALGIVFHSADTYAQELENRNLLFICVDKHGRASAFETAFHDYNYQHLTGLETAQTLSAQLFYQACLNRRLSVNDFEFHPNGTSEIKLAVLPLLVNKHLGPARFIGVYNGKNPLLFTDRVAGSVKGGIGFIRDGGIGPYVPNTLLGGDMRQYITDMRRVAITYRKTTVDAEYSEIVYSAKGIDWSTFTLPEPYISIPLPEVR